MTRPLSAVSLYCVRDWRWADVMPGVE